jgi:hypothetical protein
MLMEEKGLYQSVSIDREGAREFALSRISEAGRQSAEAAIERSFPSAANLTLSAEALFTEGDNKQQQPVLTIVPINFKLHCSACKRDEAFKPVWFQDITNGLASQQLGESKVPKTKLPSAYQLFSLVYQCQSCLGAPEAFLIRRQGLKLAMHGRSPIESVSVPQFIPEPESIWYRESVIAMKFGRPLAAIFYLRVFIEQFARRVTGITERRYGEDILSEYSSTIDDPPRSAMPSLKEWYMNLSEAIHCAKEDPEMLKKAFEDVERHFEFRRLYKVPESREKNKEADPQVDPVRESQ